MRYISLALLLVANVSASATTVSYNCQGVGAGSSIYCYESSTSTIVTPGSTVLTPFDSVGSKSIFNDTVSLWIVPQYCGKNQITLSPQDGNINIDTQFNSNEVTIDQPPTSCNQGQTCSINFTAQNSSHCMVVVSVNLSPK